MCSVVESENFYLMNLSLLREDLHKEFFPVLCNSIKFKYDLEKIIDDFILLALFVGNDFIPRLPKFEISDETFGLLFESYKRILVKSGNIGYYYHHQI